MSTTETPDTHNGHANRETWACGLHLSNTEDVYRIACQLVAEADEAESDWRETVGMDRAGITGNHAAEALEEWISDAVEYVLYEYPTAEDWTRMEWVRLMISDVGSFDRVDWHDVAAGFREDA